MSPKETATLPEPSNAPRGGPVSETRAILFGAGLFALLPLSTDIYLPAMVDIGRSFGTDVAGVQLTMVAFTVGFAIAHLAVGRLADRFGRRPVALWGLTAFALTSVLGALAPSLATLVAARFLQGLAAATGPILARTVLRDVIAPARAGRALSLMGALVGVAPVLAPLVGGLAAAVAGWRSTLWLVAAYAGVLAILFAIRLPETARPVAERAAAVPVLRALALALREPPFLIGTLTLACGYGVLFTWLSTSPFLLMGDLGLSRFHTALIYAVGSAGFVSGGLLSARLSTRLRPDRILTRASLLAVAGTALCLAAVLLGWTHWAVILLAMLPFYVGWGLCQPQAIAIAMHPFAAMAGQASAWLGAIQQVGGILFSFAAVWLGGGVATLGVMVVAALLCALVARVGRATGRPA